MAGFLDAGKDWYGSMVFGAGEPGELCVAGSGRRSFTFPGGDGGVTVFGTDIGVDTDTRDGFLARFSSDGEILWTAVARESATPTNKAVEGFNGVSVSPGGEIAVAGGFGGAKTFGAGEERETTLVSGAGDWFNGFAALYSPEGRLRWAIPVALGPAKDLACQTMGEQLALAVTFSGPDLLYITGVFLKDAAFGTSPESMVTLQPYGCADMFLMKLERVAAPR